MRLISSKWQPTHCGPLHSQWFSRFLLAALCSSKPLQTPKTLLPLQFVSTQMRWVCKERCYQMPVSQMYLLCRAGLVACEGIQPDDAFCPRKWTFVTWRLGMAGIIHPAWPLHLFGWRKNTHAQKSAVCISALCKSIVPIFPC